MSVYLKNNKRWYVDLRFERRRIRRPSPENSKRGAEAYEAVLRSKMAKGENIFDTKIVRQITFAKFITNWVRDYVQTNNKFSEQETKRSILDNHLIPFFGKKALNEIKPQDIECYKKSREAKGLSNKTINNHLTVLHKALSIAVEWGHLESTPATKWLKVMRKERIIRNIAGLTVNFPNPKQEEFHISNPSD